MAQSPWSVASALCCVFDEVFDLVQALQASVHNSLRSSPGADRVASQSAMP